MSAASTVTAVGDSHQNASNGALPPVLIPITFPSRSDHDDFDDDDNSKKQHHLQEWAMIEINGELLLPPEAVSNTASSTAIFDAHHHMELGSISFVEATNQDESSPPTPIMIIGTHELRGKIVQLQQPFLCLQKHINVAGKESIDTRPPAENSADNDATTTTQYCIKGIVKYKFIFNQYPKTIMR